MFKTGDRVILKPSSHYFGQYTGKFIVTNGDYTKNVGWVEVDTGVRQFGDNTINTYPIRDLILYSPVIAELYSEWED